MRCVCIAMTSSEWHHVLGHEVGHLVLLALKRRGADRGHVSEEVCVSVCERARAQWGNLAPREATEERGAAHLPPWRCGPLALRNSARRKY